MTHAKNHHYVPQLLLKNFSSNKGRLHVFDKLNTRPFPENQKNIASENYFYNFSEDGINHSMEEWLSQLETKAAPIIDEIVSSKNLNSINSATKSELSFFFAVQMARTKMPQEKIKRLVKRFRELLTENGQEISNLDEKLKDFVTEPTENDLKAGTAKAIRVDAPMYAPYLENKIWMLIERSQETPFIIGDHPVARKNEIDKDWSDFPGLMKIGVEFYIPLSPDLCLAMWCPSIVQGVINQFAPEKEWIVDRTFKVANILSGSKNSSKIVNALQVYWSERFLFSKNDDFGDLAEKINNLPYMRHGPRPKLNI
ncbi:DUF4238 domain-containing protein [Acidovorax sp. Leaf84]|uniref:DUF4238 domain-containing protein n=1 Tax=Acidovorax sp. Leaf84 TaxID=1736240 RepID=UPI0009ECB8E2|nr:DUF4238 domain-containing protein [Acidovorax sp. Leaf84]